MPLKLFDYVDRRGANDIKLWGASLDAKSRAKLNQKFDMLAMHGTALSTGLLSDTPSRHIKKIRINGTVALRPLLCKGPVDNDHEYTLLLGAIEKDRKFVPSDAIRIAEARRDQIIGNNSQRCIHERF
jgi:hypothetical protein